MSNSKAMTKGEREDLLRLLRSRERVMKTAAAQRSAEMLSEFEKQVSAIYRHGDDAVWAEVHAAAEDFVAEAQKKIDARCEELGIVKEFRPALHVNWYSRGENAVAERVAELRRAAKAKIAAVEEKARAEIEMMGVAAQTEIIAHGLLTSPAQEFLKSLVPVENLMPMIDTSEVINSIEDQRRRRDR